MLTLPHTMSNLQLPTIQTGLYANGTCFAATRSKSALWYDPATMRPVPPKLTSARSVMMELVTSGESSFQNGH